MERMKGRRFSRSPISGDVRSLTLAGLMLLSIWRNDPAERGGLLWWLAVGMAVCSGLSLVVLLWKRFRPRADR